MIIVHERNRAKIDKAIAEAQGKSRERTITADDVFEFCTRIPQFSQTLAMRRNRLRPAALTVLTS